MFTQTVAISLPQCSRMYALAVDPAGEPHVAYCSDAEVHYAWRVEPAPRVAQGGTWQEETISTEGCGGVVIAMDSSNRPRIAFAAGGLLHYAWHDGSAWQIEHVDDVGGVSDLVLDSAGRPHIS